MAENAGLLLLVAVAGTAIWSVQGYAEASVGGDVVTLVTYLIHFQQQRLLSLASFDQQAALAPAQDSAMPCHERAPVLHSVQQCLCNGNTHKAR